MLSSGWIMTNLNYNYSWCNECLYPPEGSNHPINKVRLCSSHMFLTYVLKVFLRASFKQFYRGLGVSCHHYFSIVLLNERVFHSVWCHVAKANCHLVNDLCPSNQTGRSVCAAFCHVFVLQQLPLSCLPHQVQGPAMMHTWHLKLPLSLSSRSAPHLSGCRAPPGTSRLPSPQQQSRWCTAFQSWWSAPRWVFRTVRPEGRCLESITHVKVMLKEWGGIYKVLLSST